MPWNLPAELKFFYEGLSTAIFPPLPLIQSSNLDGLFPFFLSVTVGPNEETKNAVVMGRKTWESLPKPPLKHRQNIVLTRDTQAAVQDE